MDRQDIINQLFDNRGTMKRGIQNYFHAMSHELPVSPSQIELLFAIKHSQPALSKQLADYLHMTPGAISQQLDVLMTKDLVTRTPDTDDRRLHLLKLTKRGDKLVVTIEKRRKEIMERVISELQTDELAVWLRVQQKMIIQLEKVQAEKKENT